MIKEILFLSLFVSTCFLVDCHNVDAFVLTPAKISIKVIDDEGAPVDGASVGIGFETGPGGREKTVSGFTDESGIFTGSAMSSRHIGGKVTKDGYYLSSFVYNFKNQKLLLWQPWNHTLEVILRKKENPVLMYARNTQPKPIVIPEVGKGIGFDLIKFDWISPYGGGTHADFIFRVERRYADWNDWDVRLILGFANEHDGIHLIKEKRTMGSVFRLPRIAPANGFNKKLVKTNSMKLVEQNDPIISEYYSEENNYIFRVRSEVDEEGHLVKAMYGKILGDIQIDPRGSETVKIYFKYYLNPDYTRNLEFDPNRNLFKNLLSRERVGN